MTLAQTETALEAAKALSEAQTVQQFQQAAIMLLFVILTAAVIYHLRRERHHETVLEGRRQEEIKRELRVVKAVEELAGIAADEEGP